MTTEEEEEEKYKTSVKEKSSGCREEMNWRKTTFIPAKKTTSIKENITMFQELVNGENCVWGR